MRGSGKKQSLSVRGLQGERETILHCLKRRSKRPHPPWRRPFRALRILRGGNQSPLLSLILDARRSLFHDGPLKRITPEVVAPALRVTRRDSKTPQRPSLYNQKSLSISDSSSNSNYNSSTCSSSNSSDARGIDARVPVRSRRLKP